MFYITHRNHLVFFIRLSIFAISFFSLPGYANKEFAVTDTLSFYSGLSFNGAIQTFEYSGNTPKQNLSNQPTSSAAYSPTNLSIRAGLTLTDWTSIHARVDYRWRLPLQLGLYQGLESSNRFHIRDLYVSIPVSSKKFDIWTGIRTFEFEPVTLFSLPNPFDQIGLQGAGIEKETFQFSAALTKEKVNTIAVDNNNHLIVNQDGSPVYYGESEYIATIFLSGRFILAEGRLFEPIFAFRYYVGTKGDLSSNKNEQLYKVKQASSLIIGGIFSRPISNGIAGTTTVWFSSLPSDKKPVSENSLPSNGKFDGAGRFNDTVPKNTIGIIDSSEFNFDENSGLLTAVYLTNNTYSYNRPLLKSTDSGDNLIADLNATSDSSNRLSIGLEPLFFVNHHLMWGVNFNGNYVSEKVFIEDANSFVITPILKWAYDKKLNSSQYIFMSLSYGIYDWKIKKFSNGAQTNFLFSSQVGAKIDF